MALITKYENQSVFDLLLQNAGAISGLFEFLENNSLSELDIPEGNYVAPEVLNKKVFEYFASKNTEVSIATGGQGVAHGAPVIITLNGAPFGVYDQGTENNILLVDQDDIEIIPTEINVNTIKINVGGNSTFIKGVFIAGGATLPEITIDSDLAGTYTSISDDGSSGSISISINGAEFIAFVSPLLLSDSDTLIVKRMDSTAIGWYKITGTY